MDWIAGAAAVVALGLWLAAGRPGRPTASVVRQIGRGRLLAALPEPPDCAVAGPHRHVWWTDGATTRADVLRPPAGPPDSPDAWLAAELWAAAARLGPALDTRY